MYSSASTVPHSKTLSVTDPEISAVSSFSEAVTYSLASNGSIYGCGTNSNLLLLKDSYATSFISPPKFSPPRLNEDIRYCISKACLAFSHFPPGSITNEPVIHEPNIPLYKFIGGWGNLSNGHLGIDPPPTEPSSGTIYEGPDLIVKKVSISEFFSVFILHNNTVLVSGCGQLDGASYLPPTDGPQCLYHPIVYNDTVQNSSELKIVDASASPHHVLLLSEDHRVFFFGSNAYYASGIQDLPEHFYVQKVSEVLLNGTIPPEDPIFQIRAQLYSSSGSTKMGLVYIWGLNASDTSTAPGLSSPTLENTFLQGRYAVRYLDQDDITKTTHDARGSCILTRPRAGNCTGMPPSADYNCIGGLWTTRGGGTNLDSLTISSPIEIDGNLTISGPLVINQQSSISVTQCLATGSIEIVKQQGDNSPSQDIISTGKHCPDISATTVNVIPTGDGKKCEKKTATLSKSETSGRITYSAIFHVDDYGCKHNYWWIILISVLGGVVVIVIIVILLVTFVKPIRAKVRPFWLRKHS